MYEDFYTSLDSECIYWENQPFTKKNNSEYQCSGLSTNYWVPGINITKRVIAENTQIAQRIYSSYLETEVI